MRINLPRALVAAALTAALLPGAAPAQALSSSLSSVVPDDRITVDIPGYGTYALHAEVVGQGLHPERASREKQLAAAAFSADFEGNATARDKALAALDPATRATVTQALAALHSPVRTPDSLAATTPIVVLGERLNDDGTLRPNLVKRLEAALQLARSRPAAEVIVTGGPTGAGHVESHAMRTWLQERGQSRVRVEDRSTSTIDSARFTRELLPAAPAVIVVTSDNHLPRAVVDFTLAFGPQVAGIGSPTDPPAGMPGPKWTYRDAVFWFLG
ncbi:YdcF family protein [Corynebacterium nasicanis]|uniref:YdcF family protein n=1 Tax=Corynebacterium nasicanis TaxID=1448267 RepID=A0ABW1QDL6_9CORY